jgi:7-cyano-7-deazaguanine synthase in queuosine biosynthesis
MSNIQVPKKYLILCNGAEPLEGYLRSEGAEILTLEYRDNIGIKNVKLKLPQFIENLYHLSDRILDLLEIAAYIYCADRLLSRGSKSAVEYHSWSRSIKYLIKVRDFDFWNDNSVKNMLSESLKFMTGDYDYEFNFSPGHVSEPTNLFDTDEFRLNPSTKSSIILFSGGLDSLSGVLSELETTKNNLCLISHNSGNPGSTKTRRGLIDRLKEIYPGRIIHYNFRCGLTREESIEESQRIRSFIYSSIAYAISTTLPQTEINFYENGITSFNLPKRQDLINARASRTTHPKTIALMEKLLSTIQGSDVTIKTPFLWKTKTDIIENIISFGKADLISSSVSCSKTNRATGIHSHCGGCSQCIDRRFATFASLTDNLDTGIYSIDIGSDQLPTGEIKTSVIDYIRQSIAFGTYNRDQFYQEYLPYLQDIIENVNINDDSEAAEAIYTLCNRHGQQILSALRRINSLYNDFTIPNVRDTVIEIIATKEYLKAPSQLLIQDICNRLSIAIPLAYQKTPPHNESDLNDKIESILSGDRIRLEREHPSILFALASTVPDHSYSDFDVLIESKLTSDNTPPSKITDGIAADLTKYPAQSNKLFIVYDKQRKIKHDPKFSTDFEGKGNCKILIIR